MSELTTKPWYQSKTIIAGVVQIVAGAAISSGFITPEEGKIVIETGVDTVGAVVAVGAGIATIYGRVVATTGIGKA